VNRHRLGGVLNAADGVQHSLLTQRVLQQPMRGRRTRDALWIKPAHASQQTHAVGMRDQPGNLRSRENQRVSHGRHT
jgi:hypothetical protein